MACLVMPCLECGMGSLLLGFETGIAEELGAVWVIVRLGMMIWNSDCPGVRSPRYKWSSGVGMCRSETVKSQNSYEGRV